MWPSWPLTYDLFLLSLSLLAPPQLSPRGLFSNFFRLFRMTVIERMLYTLCLKQLSGQVWWRGSFNPSTQEARVGDSEFEASLVFKGVLISQPLSQTKQQQKN